MTQGRHCPVVVCGNEKGGSGKSTMAMHLIVGLLRSGRSVGSLDLDVRQRTLSRYVDNRRARAETGGRVLPMPTHVAFAGGTDAGDGPWDERLAAAFDRLAEAHDVIVVDTPGAHNALNRFGHARADVLITPVNDSFVDLDVLARIEGGVGDDGAFRVVAPSHYAEMVWEARKRRAAGGGRPLDWIVMRNRLSSLDARNKRRVEAVLAEMARRFGFRLVPGFGERVIFRELFPAGLTLMDLGEAAGGDPLTFSQVAARQEVRTLVSALGLPAGRAAA